MGKHVRLAVVAAIAVVSTNFALSSARASAEQAMSPQTSKPTALILGRVIDTEGRPVESAVVSVRTYQGLQTDQARSNTNGDFLLRGVPPGTWYVTATRDGYELYPSGSRVTLIEAADRFVSATVRMAKQAVIAGQVTDESGEPVVGATVRVQTFGQGGLWDAGISAVTDDRGRYRVWTLRPGPRLVSVQPSYAAAASALFDARSGADAKAATAARQQLSSLGFGSIDRDSPAAIGVGGSVVTASGIHPSSMVRSAGQLRVFRTEYHDSGTAVELKAGQVVENVNLRLGRVLASRVSGRVEGPTGSVYGLPVQLMVADVPEGQPQRTAIVAARTMTGAGGEFTFPVVPAGRYTLATSRQPTAPSRALSSATVTTSAGSVDVGAVTAGATPGRLLAEGDTLWASVPLAVAGEDIDGLAVTLQRAAQLSGRLAFDGTSPVPTPERLNRLVLAVWSDRQAYSSGVVDTSGQFRTPGLAPGHYVLRLSTTAGSEPLTWYPKSVTLAGRDVTDTFIDLEDDDVGDIVFTLTDRATTVSGAVRDSRGRPVSDATVLAFPVDRVQRAAGSISIWRVKKVGTDARGGWVMTAMLPGQYYFVATVEDLPDRWNDPALLISLEPRAQRVKLVEGNAARIDLMLPPETSRGRLSDETQQPPSGPFADEMSDERQPAGVCGESAPAAGSIACVVYADADRKQPVRQALVTLIPAAGGTSLSAHTDDQGRVSFTAVPDGRYRVVASRLAYLTTEYGARRAGRTGVPVQVTAGASLPIAIVMPRGSVITGRVLDDRGQPLVNAVVRALSLRATPDGPSLATAAGATPAEAVTDDRGEYRIYGLARGDYYIGAAPPPSVTVGRETTEREVAWVRKQLPVATATVAAAAGRSNIDTLPPPAATYAQAPAFYPTGATIGGARSIRLGDGEEQDGVDVHFQRQPVFALSGVVTGSTGQPSAGARLTLIPDGLSVPSSRYGSSSTPGLAYSYGGVVSVSASASGAFDIRSLAPGQYRLMARGSKPGTNSVTEWATVPLSIGAQDLAQVAVTLQPAATVTVRLESAGPATPSIGLMSFSLTPAVQAGDLVSISGVRADADGRATFRGVIPGEYWIRATGLPAPWMLRAASSGGRDVLDRPLSVEAADADSDVVLQVTDRPSQIAGTFTDASGRPASDYMVVVFPADRRQWRPGARQITAVRPATDGRFVASPLPAGDYLLAAVWDAEPDEWFDPDFLIQLMAASIAVTLAEGEARVQNIRLAGARVLDASGRFAGVGQHQVELAAADRRRRDHRQEQRVDKRRAVRRALSRA